MTEHQLNSSFSALRNGDRDAFHTLYEALSPPVYAVLLRLVLVPAFPPAPDAAPARRKAAGVRHRPSHDTPPRRTVGAQKRHPARPSRLDRHPAGVG